ncbi:hypothetical protein BV25DRAFT_1919742 [Artomyces pyxidatus]|uniref:Uncharacterized protein n=1 Tax=Artomyces pyxidatus TaxID=48021 RepID=A0ACB8SNN9_9AGAM|nr:hypothetical protein BV25DRAFT_1919742 [Artomyces pyxidatus]
MAGTKRTSTSDNTNTPEAKRTRASHNDETDKTRKQTSKKNTTLKETGVSEEDGRTSSTAVEAKTGDKGSDQPTLGDQASAPSMSATATLSQASATDDATALPMKAAPPSSVSNAKVAGTDTTEENLSLQLTKNVAGADTSPVSAKAKGRRIPDAVIDHVKEYIAHLNSADKLIQILPSILTFSNKKKHVYAATKIPSKLIWRNNRLSVPGSPEPIRIFVVGQIRTCWFTDGDGKPAKRVTLRVIPSQEEAVEALQNLVKQYTEPKKAAEDFVLNDVHAAAFSSERVRGKPGTVGVPYPNIWDGRKAFSFDRSLMENLAPEFLKEDDIVMEEITVTRFSTSKLRNSQPDRPDVKRITFELRGVVLLSDSTEDGNDSNSGEDDGSDIGEDADGDAADDNKADIADDYMNGEGLITANMNGEGVITAKA